jgi:hypothetical protein
MNVLALSQDDLHQLRLILDEEVQAQREDPATPWAADGALDLRAALDRGDELAGCSLTRIMTEEVSLLGVALEEVVNRGDGAEVRRIASYVAVAAGVLAQLGG